MGQPPSGGCVLKREAEDAYARITMPAAFGRLGVETFVHDDGFYVRAPAAFGRLCVETAYLHLRRP